MREAIGGTWLFGIVILFIALFASFLSYSISYTRAFNAKNEILNLIERNEGYNLCNRGTPAGVSYDCSDVMSLSDQQLSANTSVETQALYIIKKSGYNYTAASDIDCRTAGHQNAATRPGGYCVTRYCSTGEGSNVHSSFYRVTTFIALKLPVVEITLKVPISGETRTIYFDSSGEPCQNVSAESVTGRG